jgi:hypothetical protein
MTTLRNWLLTSLCLTAFACTPNVVSSTDAGDVVDAGTQDAGEVDAGIIDAGEMDAGTVDAGAGPYPAGPYGVSVNRVIENFTFPGYTSSGAGVKINTLPKLNNLDLQAIRNAVDSTGKRFRFMLLDISAGWCGPCNQEAQELGLNGTKSSLTANWLSRGGIFFTVLVEGYNESTHNPPVAQDIETWANQHAAQTTLAIDPTQNLITQGINPSAFPTNLVIDLRTMKIVAAWYGLDNTYQKWEAALNGP